MNNNAGPEVQYETLPHLSYAELMLEISNFFTYQIGTVLNNAKLLDQDSLHSLLKNLASYFQENWSSFKHFTIDSFMLTLNTSLLSFL